MLERDSPWTDADMVAGFARSSPNEVLMRYAAAEHARIGSGTALDIGCGAGRNAVPLAASGWTVLGLDLSAPMLAAARDRARAASVSSRITWALTGMEDIPARDASMDLVIAHGIWNLAHSSRQFRQAVGAAARAAKPGAALFVFTFSRHTLPDDAAPVAGESFVFTQFSGRPQIFLTADQLVTELRAAGFEPDPAVPLTEYNRPAPGSLRAPGGPVIYEAAFRRMEKR
jgi:ubiquinone/menaquinone biosynthesis C-methylase UbiE